ncbi:ubiquitin domain-containing protein 2-like isoform X3 [Penaeus chinensis]|uniref:ubiquitin domain-containing protein 2-like isoform X3 n=1 Tax=Penaeus chinensis TaxID=139456 RepID=UPI001FB7281D|nr:ubiquitin domain-containing protein 2-like isoform X3 [Penaeus chinensis]
MGGCVGTAREGSASSRTSSGEGSTSLRGGTSIGKNVPLRHEKIRWKSDMPLTEGQVRSKRDEFWDTAPAFEGRREIWDALKAAAGAIENQDYDLAQAIIDGASITLPNEGSVEGEEQVLKVRLSTTSKDVKLPVRSTDTIATAKRKLEMQENLGAVRQRWFYSGKLLGDRLHVCECNIQHNYVVQAIITEERMTPVDS